MSVMTVAGPRSGEESLVGSQHGAQAEEWDVMLFLTSTSVVLEDYSTGNDEGDSTHNVDLRDLAPELSLSAAAQATRRFIESQPEDLEDLDLGPDW